MGWREEGVVLLASVGWKGMVWYDIGEVGPGMVGTWKKAVVCSRW